MFWNLFRSKEESHCPAMNNENQIAPQKEDFTQLKDFPKVKNFIAIDFETAKSLDPCQIGIAVVHDGKLTKTLNYLIRPIGNEYNQHNIKVHHITPEKTQNAHSFPEVWKEIKDYFNVAIVVAHNATFDASVLKFALSTYNIPAPHIKGFICTCELNHGEHLRLACARYNITLEAHHNGEDDAINCAKLYLAYINGEQPLPDCKLPKEAFMNDNYSGHSYAPIGHKQLRGDVLKKDLSCADHTNPFYDRKVVISGVFEIEREELALKIKDLGADLDSNVGARTNFLLIGKDPGPAKIKKAKEMIAAGKPIRILEECDVMAILQGKGYEKYCIEL